MKKGLMIAGIALSCSLIGAMGGAAVYSNSLKSGDATYESKTSEAAGVFKQPKMTPALFHLPVEPPTL